MTYELAKQLKDAGFPQTGIHSPLTYHRGEDEPYEPYLDELIKACGDGFYSLEQIPIKRGWRAIVFISLEQHIYADGQTPEEAVAKLYLAINKQ